MRAIRVLLQAFPYCVLLLFAGNANAQIQGLLFTNPDERAYLDFLREEFLRNSAEQGFDIEEVEIPEIPETDSEPSVSTYSFGGILSRRDGPPSVWLNGALIMESRLPEGFSMVESGSGVVLRVNLEGGTYQLLPGQTLNMPAGTVVETQRNLMSAMNNAPSLPAGEGPAEITPVATQLLDSEPTLSSEEVPGPETPLVSETAASPGALESSVTEMSDSEVDALFEILESRRQERASDSEDVR